MKPNEQIVLPDEMLSVLSNPLHVGLFVELLKRADESGNVEVSERALAKEFDITYKTLRIFFERCIKGALMAHIGAHLGRNGSKMYLIEDYWNYKRKKSTSGAIGAQSRAQLGRNSDNSQPNSKPGRTTKLRKLRDASENQAYINFCNWIEENAPCVCNNIAPLTEEQFMNLKSDFGAKLIAQCVEDLENRKDLRTKYSSLYMTLIKWCKRRRE